MSEPFTITIQELLADLYVTNEEAAAPRHQWQICDDLREFARKRWTHTRAGEKHFVSIKVIN